VLSNDLKEIIDLSGGRYIIVESGKPKYIVMSFDEYQSAILSQKSVQTLTEEELVAKINSDIALWKENRQGTSEQLAGEVEKLEDIKYEDLPK